MKRWPTKPLGELLKVQNGFAFKSELFNDDGKGLPIIRIRDLARGFSQTFYYGGHDSVFEVENGDFLIGMDGEFCCYRWKGGKALLNQRVCRLQNFSRDLDASYVFYGINEHLRKIEDSTAFVTVKHLSSKQIASIEMSVPPLAEQKRIVRLLDEADGLRKIRAQADNRTAALVPALFNEMFGDPAQNPKGCKVVRLEEVATRITDGVHLKPNYTTTGVPFISVKNITTGQLKFDECKFISAEDHAKFTKRTKPEYLDVLYTKVGATYGRPALVDTRTEFSIYVSVCLIKPRKDLIDPHFLQITMGTPAIKNQADRSIKGIGVPDLHLDQIQKFLLPLPPLALQKEFAERVTEIRKLEATQTASRRRLESLFQSMLHRAFTGDL